MSIWLTQLANWCREVWPNVVEYQGWQNRARSSGGYASNPLCVMWHHTASGASWDGKRDADYIATGDSSAPLSNLYIDRSGQVWVIAAGATNTNGKGGPQSFSRGTVPVDGMNSRAVGIEMGNNGVGEQWSRSQVDAAFAVTNNINAKLGNTPRDVCTHWVWAPTRKIDPATCNVAGPWVPRSSNSSGTWNLDDIRNECVNRSSTKPQPPQPNPTPDEDGNMKVYLIQDSRGAWWSSDMFSGRVWVPDVEVGMDGINAFGWGGSPFCDPPGQGPWVLSEKWQPYVDGLPITGPAPAGSVMLP